MATTNRQFEEGLTMNSSSRTGLPVDPRRTCLWRPVVLAARRAIEDTTDLPAERVDQIAEQVTLRVIDDLTLVGLITEDLTLVGLITEDLLDDLDGAA